MSRLATGSTAYAECEDLSPDESAEYVDAAEWCAARGLSGASGDPLPENLSARVAAEIAADVEAFMDHVRLAAYAEAMERLNLPENAP